MNVPSASIHDCTDVTKDERKAIEARTPPYDGVRTYADLLAVRDAFVPDKIVILPHDATVADVTVAREKLKAE